MRNTGDDLDGWQTCADCDAVVNELRKLIGRAADSAAPEELRRADRQLSDSLSIWLAVHRGEVSHQGPAEIQDEQALRAAAPSGARA